MKNILISILLGLFIASCTQSKYTNLDSQFASTSDKKISAKYNSKIHTNSIRKKQLVRQIAIATQE